MTDGNWGSWEPRIMIIRCNHCGQWRDIGDTSRLNSVELEPLLICPNGCPKDAGYVGRQKLTPLNRGWKGPR